MNCSFCHYDFQRFIFIDKWKYMANNQMKTVTFNMDLTFATELNMDLTIKEVMEGRLL